MKEAIIGAANDLGEDGHGFGGMRGYMRRLGRNEPRTFAMLIRAVMPTQVKVETHEEKVETEEELRSALAAIGVQLERFSGLQFYDREQKLLELNAEDAAAR